MKSEPPPISAEIESTKEANPGNQNMLKKLIACFFVIVVGFIGVSAFLSVSWAQLRQDPSDRRTPAGETNVAAPLVRNQIEAKKLQTQMMLDGMEVQRAELLQSYTAEHPKVRLLDAQAEMLKAQLVAEVDSAATRAKLGPKLSELKQKIERAEKNVSSVAALSRNTDSLDKESKNAADLTLRKAVQDLFDLRMQLQKAQLDDAQAKTDASRKRLAKRQTLADQIVKRRVGELLQKDETKRNEDALQAAATTKASGSAEHSRSVKKPSEVNDPLSRYSTFEIASGLEGYYADIPELEGEWRLQTMYVDATQKPVEGASSIRIDSNEGASRIRIDSNKMLVSDRIAFFREGRGVPYLFGQRCERQAGCLGIQR